MALCHKAASTEYLHLPFLVGDEISPGSTWLTFSRHLQASLQAPSETSSIPQKTVWIYVEA